MSLLYIGTSPLICKANQWTGSYMKGASVMKELKLELGEDGLLEASLWGQTFTDAAFLGK